MDRLVPATMSDLQAVVSLFRRVTAHLIGQGIDQWNELYPDSDILTEDIRRGDMLLLIKNDTILSAVVRNEFQDAGYSAGRWQYGGRIAVIHRLCVDPGLQRQGVGQHTLMLCEEHLRDQGYDAVRLDAYSGNPHALRMYERAGYNHVGKAHFQKGIFELFEKNLAYSKRI